MMQRYALTESGVVHMVTESATQPAPELGNWVECPEFVGQGFVFDGLEFSKPTPSRKQAIFSRLAEIDALSNKPRTRRELSIGNVQTLAYVNALDNEAAALRTELAAIQ